ncbi:MAG: 5-carboxymethyl-2-hydroxymuconate isomerase [Aliishimia sp.]
MPHLTLQHSAALSQRYDMTALCENLRKVMVAQGCFPTGGIRVRAWPTPAQAVADGHPDNVYVDLILRMAVGRTADVKRAAGDAIMAATETFFADDLTRAHIAIALEIVEIEPEFSWKTNTIHARLKGTS